MRLLRFQLETAEIPLQALYETFYPYSGKRID